MQKASDRMEEACGILGIHASCLREDLVGFAYYGMHALQHRGQQSAGVTIADSLSQAGTVRQKTVKNMGLVSEVFSVQDLQSYVGNLIIGHVRYATTGDVSMTNCQPLCAESLLGNISLAHNGNLINTQKLRHDMLAEGTIFQTTTDTELILRLLGKNAKYGLREALTRTLLQVEGSFALVMLVGDTLIGVRDAHGIRPLCMGRTADGLTVLASESCALDAIGAKLVRDILPGEMIIMDASGNTESLFYTPYRKKRACSFEYIYFARPDSVMDGMDIYHVRHESGRYLYEQQPIEADVVIGVPDSGIPAAIGFSEASGIPYGVGLVKNKYVGRTFIEATQALREQSVHVKLNPIRSLIDGQRVVVVDDSLVRGTTARRLIQMLREAGAREVHFRSASPIVKSECYFGVDIASKQELIGSRMQVQEICASIDATTLDYLSLENLHRVLKGSHFCMGCFTGQYPLENRELMEVKEACNKLRDA